jgi:hypothetical protein
MFQFVLWKTIFFWFKRVLDQGTEHRVKNDCTLTANYYNIN